jgi:hypothetical protein
MNLCTSFVKKQLVFNSRFHITIWSQLQICTRLSASFTKLLIELVIGTICTIVSIALHMEYDEVEQPIPHTNNELIATVNCSLCRVPYFLNDKLRTRISTCCLEREFFLSSWPWRRFTGVRGRWYVGYGNQQVSLVRQMSDRCLSDA